MILSLIPSFDGWEIIIIEILPHPKQPFSQLVQ